MIDMYNFKDTLEGTDKEVRRVALKKDLTVFLSSDHYHDYKAIEAAL
jgi:hypothetical protein